MSHRPRQAAGVVASANHAGQDTHAQVHPTGRVRRRSTATPGSANRETLDRCLVQAVPATTKIRSRPGNAARNHPRHISFATSEKKPLAYRRALLTDGVIYGLSRIFRVPAFSPSERFSVQKKLPAR